MSFAKLYEFSAALRQYPVKLESVLDVEIARLTSQDEIYYVPVELDENVSLGHIKQYRELRAVYDQDPLWITQIRYSEGLNLCWKRLVCCKELMHAFDSPDERTPSYARLDQLMAEIESPLPTAQQSAMFKSETKALWMALAVLCPLPVRTHLAPTWKDGAMSNYEIALKLRIPEAAVPNIKSEEFPEIVNDLLK